MVDSDLPYYLQLRVVDQDSTWLPTLHSFVQAQHDGRWVFLAGRTNGLHDLQRGGMNAFPTSAANREVWVVDPQTRESWHRPLDDPSSHLDAYAVNALSSTNGQFYQSADRLYIAGGYGHHPSEGFLTFDTLTAIDIPELMNWVVDGGDILDDTISQIRDPLFQVTGGAMYQVGELTHLVLGQNFVGGYNPFRQGDYTQQVRTFRVVEGIEGLAVADVRSTPADPNYRRRDLNVAPVLRKSPDGQNLQEGLVAFSGVFTIDNGAWTVPIEIDAAGNPTMADPSLPETFKQGLNGYHSAKLGLYSESQDEMHNVLFGGISLQYYDWQAEQLVTDPMLPFINQVTSIVSDSDHHFVQHLLSTEFPQLFDETTGRQLRFGSNAEFMISPSVPVYLNGVIQLDAITQATSLGHVFGGIVADAPNGGETAASNLVFEVVLTPRTAGDFDGSGTLDVADLDELTSGIRASSPDARYDLNLDRVIDAEDRRVWIVELRHTYFGDADLDDEFNSGDLVQVFQAGEYEDPIAANSTWSTGDWDGDADFTSSDLVLAFQEGGYENGPRGHQALAVPEPHASLFLILGALAGCQRRRIQRRRIQD